MFLNCFLKKINSLSIGKKIVFYCSLLMPLVSCFLMGISTSNHSSIRKESLSASISEISNSNITKDAYLKFDISNKDEENISRKVYSYYWRDNFNYTSQLLCLSSPDTFEPSKYKLSNNVFCLSEETIVADAFNYSSQQDLLRFETIRINIYKFRERRYETESNGYDGFIYIPDFIADTLIENSNGLLKYYDDLLIDGQIPDNLKDYLIINLDIDGMLLRFKIANVFHVNGYNKNYILEETNIEKCLINDGNTGQKIKRFIGDFCVAYSYQLIQNNNYSLVSIINKKQYAIIDYLSVMSQQSNNKIQGCFYSVKENKTEPISFSAELFDTFNHSGFSKMLYLFLLIFSIVFFAGSFVLVFVCDRFILNSDCTFTYHLFQIVILLILHAIMTILSVFISNSFMFHSIYSKYFGITSILVLLFEAFMLLRARRIKNESY